MSVFQGSLPGPRVGSWRLPKTRESSRVGSGGVLENITGRVELGQEVSKYDGSGRVTLTGSGPREVIGPVKIREKKDESSFFRLKC